MISGTKGYVYVPAPWWKTEYYELRYEDINKNSKFFYKFEGEGLRYEIIEFIKRIKDHNMMAGSLTCMDMLAESKVIDCFMKDRYNLLF